MHSTITALGRLTSIKYRALIIILPFFFMAFTSINDDIKTEYYYSLKFLKQSSPPQKVQMVRTDNLSREGNVLSRGILFTYKNRGARVVHIAGDFSKWKPVKMTRSTSGIWFYFLSSTPSDRELKYKFMVDGIWFTDPLNPDRADDGMGSYVSVVTPVESSEGRHVTYRIADRNTIEFRIYWPEASFISVVGDFNHWNPENDILVRGGDGIWRLTKRLSPGVYRYKYIIDGKWVPDTYNERSASDDTGQVCSILEVR